MGPITKATVALTQFALWVNKVRNQWIFNFLWKVGTWIQTYHTLTLSFWGDKMRPGETFSQPFIQLFAPTPVIFERLKSALNANDTIQWLVLLIGLLYLAFRDKGGLTWITTLTPLPENKDAAIEPDPAPHPTSEMNQPDWMGVLVKEVGQLLREYISPAGEKPSPCPNEGESDGPAVEPMDATTVQAPVRPQGQPQPAAVALMEKRKFMVKSDQPVSNGGEAGPSQLTGKSRLEITTESLSYESP